MTLNQLKYAVTITKSKSMNEAAKELFVSQPSLSAAIRDLEEEVGVELFHRSNRGITTTPEGEEFIGYAKQVLEQYNLMEQRFVSHDGAKAKFSVSMQHYTFAVDAFMELVKHFGMENYEFMLYETKTHDVIENVRNFKSEIGILYINGFNRQVLFKLFDEYGLEFHELLNCGIYVYIAKTHPLAKKKKLKLEDLADYPCLAFDQGTHNSFYFAEEVLSTYRYDKLIRVSDRGTMLNLMTGLNGYTLSSGIICEDLNGEHYCAVRLDTDETMQIGYLIRKGATVSKLGKQYIEEILKYKDKGMK